MSSRWRVLLPLLLVAAGCDKGPPPPVPKEQAEGYYIKGNTEYLQGKFDAALASFKTMSELSPADPRLPAALGEVYLSMGKLDEARNLYAPAHERAVAWNDPAIGIDWPLAGAPLLSAKDAAAPRLADAEVFA